MKSESNLEAAYRHNVSRVNPAKRRFLQKEPTLIWVMLMVSVSSLDYSIKAGALLALMLCMALGKVSDSQSQIVHKYLGTISRQFFVFVGPAIILILVAHIVGDELSFPQILSDVNTVFILFLFIPIVLMMSGSLARIENMVDAVNAFITFFSIGYLLLIGITGLPTGRGSALGYISSNYVASFLLLCYPLLVYYYASNKDHLKSRRFKWSAFGILLSFCIILTTGSRTALGIVVVLLVALVFIPTISSIQRAKTIMLLLILVIATIAASVSFPEIQVLIERALGALSGGVEVSDDVRALIWAQGWNNFLDGNIFFGNGSSVVPEFNAPAHNLFLELLLQIGFFGAALYITCSIAIVFQMFKKSTSLQKYIALLLIVVFSITAFFQPFFTTGYTCGILFWCSVITIILDRESASCI